jgi:hypothetical protein
MLAGQERRTGPRAPLAGTAVVHCGDAKVACEILDVGTMGIGLLAPQALPAGEFVRVVFRIGAANTRPMGAEGGPERLYQADGVVVVADKHSAGCRLGIQFTVIEGHVATQIHAYVSKQVGPDAARRRTGEYASMEAYPPAGDAEAPEAEASAATGTDDEDAPRSPSSSERDAPIDRELLRLYLDAIRTVDSTRKR